MAGVAKVWWCASFALAAASMAQAQPAPRDARIPALHLSDAGSGLKRPYSEPSAIEIPVQPRTSIDHRFARDGLVGQAGYLCGIGGIGPDSDAPRGGPSSLFGHQGTFLGATLAYGFR